MPSSTLVYTAPALAALATHGFRYIRLAWVDYIAIVRYRVIPLAHFQKLVDQRLPKIDTVDNGNGDRTPVPGGGRRGGITLTKLALALVFLHVPQGFSGIGEYVYVPDMHTLRIAPYADVSGSL